MKKTINLVGVLAGLSFASSHAATIAINFRGDGGPSGSGDYGATVTQTAFGVAAGDWVADATNSETVGGVTVAGVTASWTMANDFSLGTTLPLSFANGEEQVAFGHLGDGGDNGAGADISLSGLSAWLAATGGTSYKVDLIYATRDSSATFGFKDTPLLNTVGGSLLGTFVAGPSTTPTSSGLSGQYAVGTVLGLTSNTLFIDGQNRDRTDIGDPANLRGTIAGLIITSVPEPSSILLLGLGGLALCSSRRRS